MRSIIWGLAILVISPAAAHATSGGHGGGGPSSAIPAAIDLELAIRGHITPRCELSLASNNIDTILTDGPGRASVGLAVNCNQRMSVSMQSRNGGLLHEKNDVWDHSTGFTGFLPYELEFSVDADGASAVRENSRDIQAAPGGGSIGVIPYRARGNLKLNWTPEGNLFGGRYGDVIEIRVSGEGEADHPRH